MRKGNRRSPSRMRRAQRAASINPYIVLPEDAADPFNHQSSCQAIQPELHERIYDLFMRTFIAEEARSDETIREFVNANIALVGTAALGSAAESLEFANEFLPKELSDSALSVMLHTLTMAMALGLAYSTLKHMKDNQPDAAKAISELIKVLTDPDTYDIRRCDINEEAVGNA